MTGTWWPEVRVGELIAYLTDEEYARLLEVTVPVVAEPGDVIFYKGAPSKSLVIVEDGEVEAFEESMGKVFILGAAGAGSVTGEVGFLDGRPRSNHVRARTACRLRRLSRESFLNLVGEDAMVFAKLVIALAELLASRYRGLVAELEPVRALVASVREAAKNQPAEMIQELDDSSPLPEQAQAIQVLKAVARQTKDLAEL